MRSSAFAEDGRQASFAGQLDTTLGATTTAQVVQAGRRTAHSGAGPEVTGYAAGTGQAAGNVVPVIVQVMVEPEAAGVLFTRHPVCGADQVVIEAAGGLGDKVVGGTVTPQAWTVDGGGITGPGPAEAPVLTRAQVLALDRLGRRIEAIFGVPQDIEWAVADEKVWILQTQRLLAAGCTAWQLAEMGIGEQTITLTETIATLQGLSDRTGQGRSATHLPSGPVRRLPSRASPPP